MAKKDNAAQKAAEQAAAQQAPATEAPKVETPVANPNTKGLTQGEKVAYLAAIQTERAFAMNSEKPNRVIIDGMTMLAQATIIDIGIGEIACGTSAVGCISVINEKNYGFFRDMAQEMGVALPEFKALPAPTEEQLKKAGIAGALPGAKMITIDKKNVSKEAINKKKEEIRATEKAVENPADVKNQEQLKASLTAMLVKPVADEKNANRPDPRVQRTIDFYKGYLTIQANHSDKKEEALAAVKERSRVQLLTEISEIVGPCPFALSGISKFLRNYTQEIGSPLSAYCFYRRCAVAKDTEVDDQYVADLVRTILIWSCKSNIAEYTASIKKQKEIVKNEKGAAKAATETAIRYNEKQIEEMNAIIEMVTNPSLDIADNVVDGYKAEEGSAEYKLAHRVADDIIKTYYPKYKDNYRTKLDETILLQNIQQHAGIIINMFRDPLAQSINYSTNNLVSMVEKPAEEAAAKEPGDEEQPKN